MLHMGRHTRHDRSTMLGRLLQIAWICFLEKKRKRNIVGEFAKMFEIMVGVELLESDKRPACVTHVGTVVLGKTLWRTSP